MDATSIGVLGNSIDALNGAITGADGIGNYYWPVRGYLHQANVLLGHRLKFVQSQGVGGGTSAQILARVTSITQGSPVPARCVVGNPINDWVNSMTLAQSQTNMQAIFTALLAAGVQPIALAATPSSYIYASGTAQGYLLGYNDWLKDLCRSNPGILLFDPYSALTDAANGGPLTSLFVAEGDGGHVHPNHLGAYAMGRVLANLLSHVLPPVDMLADDSTDSTNILTNGLMSGVAGEGNTPTGWGIAKAAGGTYDGRQALVPRLTPGQGFWWELTGTAAGGIQAYQHKSTGWAVGDNVVGQIEFETDEDWQVSAQDFYLVISYIAGGSVIASDCNFQTQYGHNTFRWPKGVFRTPPMAVPVNTTRIDFTVYMQGQGTVRLGRASLKKTAVS